MDEGENNVNENVKKTRKKRAIIVDDDVEGTEVSLYVKGTKEADIKITFLHKKNSIYKQVIKIYFKDKYIKNFDMLNYCNLLYYDLILANCGKVNKVYQSLSNILGNSIIKDFEIKHLKQNPYFQATYGFNGYTKYSELIKREFFEKPLLEKGKVYEN